MPKKVSKPSQRNAPRDFGINKETGISELSNEILRNLKRDWQQSGLSKGDVVLIHSNMGRTVRRCSVDRSSRPAIELFVDSFLDAVGSAGTVLFPLFNFGFSKGEPFDLRNTPSRMGKLTEAARLHPDCVRTEHPIYSFGVIGAQSDRFQGVNNISGYGDDSPFAILRELDGKIASVDLDDQHSMTFYHHVEEMNKVPYRFMKKYDGAYTNWEGQTENRQYSLYVRDEDRGVRTHVNPAGELLWESGLYSGYRPKEGTGLRVINANKMFEFVSDLIQKGKAEGLLYKVEPPTDE